MRTQVPFRVRAESYFGSVRFGSGCEQIRIQAQGGSDSGPVRGAGRFGFRFGSRCGQVRIQVQESSDSDAGCVSGLAFQDVDRAASGQSIRKNQI